MIMPKVGQFYCTENGKMTDLSRPNGKCLRKRTCPKPKPEYDINVGDMVILDEDECWGKEVWENYGRKLLRVTAVKKDVVALDDFYLDGIPWSLFKADLIKIRQ